MSLQSLMLQTNKPWLNPRVNDLTIDGTLIKTNGLLELKHLVNGPLTVGTNGDVVSVTINNPNYQTTTYEVNGSFSCQFTATNNTIINLSLLVINDDNGTVLYNGVESYTTSGANTGFGQSRNISVVDVFTVDSNVTKNFTLSIKSVITNTPGDPAPNCKGACLFKSV